MFVDNRDRHPTESDDPVTVTSGPAPQGTVPPVECEAAQSTGGFQAMGLSAETLAAVERAGYTVPTPVQAGLIPRALAGIDVLGQARTGTGKTAAFVLPILECVARERRSGGPRALVLVPTIALCKSQHFCNASRVRQQRRPLASCRLLAFGINCGHA